MRRLETLGMGLAVLMVLAAGCNKDEGDSGDDEATPTQTKIAAPKQDTPTPQQTRAASGGGEQINLGMISISPSAPTAGDRLRAQISVPAGVLAEYQWYVNGQAISGASGQELPAGAFKKGDKVAVEVTGTSRGTSATKKSNAIVIQNQNPSITSSPGPKGLDGYQLVATDPDGDTLTYKLEGAPSGMSISSGGKISWPGPYEAGKQYTVKVIAEDDGGAQAIQVVPITIPKGS